MPSRIHCVRGLPEVHCVLARPTNVSSPSLRQFQWSCRGILLRRNSDSLSEVSCRRREFVPLRNCASRALACYVELLFFVDVDGWRVCDVHLIALGGTEDHRVRGPCAAAFIRPFFMHLMSHPAKSSLQSLVLLTLWVIIDFASPGLRNTIMPQM